MNPDSCENLPVWRPGHDWRLFSRHPVYEYNTDESYRGIATAKQVAWKHTWYCTKCRKITVDQDPL